MYTHPRQQPNTSQIQSIRSTETFDKDKNTQTHPLSNSITSVKNTTLDLSIREREKSLFHAASSISPFKEPMSRNTGPSQVQRLTRLGLAVTAIYNFHPEPDDAGVAWKKAKDICEKNPRTNEGPVIVDPAQIGRGAGLINDMLAAETTLDSTLYAQSLCLGIDYCQAMRVDLFEIETLTTLWNIRDRVSNASTAEPTPNTLPSTTSTTH